MKKLVSVVLLLALLSAAAVSFAETSTQFVYSRGTAFPFYNRTYGNGSEVSAFEVKVPYGNGTLRFTQEKGIAVERSVLNWLTDDNQEWGKYHIYYKVNGIVRCEDWDDSYNSGEFNLYLNETGTYVIWVVPFTNEEINNSYVVDHFERWNKAPKWNSWGEQGTCINADYFTRRLTPADIFID